MNEKVHHVDDAVPESERSPVIEESMLGQGCKWGKWYDEGEKICLSGRVYVCEDGTWKANGNAC